ncbi:MAG: hypothetical protein A2202_08740 [Bdellovibrionales bacterium RIFOXYA1_FULL_36_14]|nr:MAG: hypothetical protein A2202_08740 [Bdellovibrionales bacterium RIFOXYA1_FULL_36_14]
MKIQSMNSYREIFFSLVLFLLYACSNAENMQNTADPVGVNFDVSDLNHSEESKIHITESDLQNRQGPIVEGVNENFDEVKRRKKSVGLILGPGLNRTILYASMFAVFEKKSVPIHYIAGIGYGAIVASMYASKMSSSKIEWCFYNFFNKIKGKKPFSKAWNAAVKEHLLTQINGKNIEDFDKVLVLPVWDQNKNMITYKKRGNLEEALKFNYTLATFLEEEHSLSEFNYFDRDYFQKNGVDLLVAVNLLNNVKFSDVDSFSILGYEKLKNNFEKNKKYVDIFYNFTTNNILMDQPENVPELLLKASKESEKLSELILGEINN